MLMPEKIADKMPDWLRDRYPAEKRAAVDHLRALIDEGMLREIAEADYERDVEKHLVALKPIWEGCGWGEMHHWYPMEVLELIRWSEPEDSDWTPGSIGIRGHRMRAFSCAVLLATPNFEPEKETLIQMLDSMFIIGDGALDAMARFLVWRLESLGREEDRPFFVLALSAIAGLTMPGISAEEQRDLAGWIEEEEAQERQYLAGFRPSWNEAPWLFGLSFSEMRNDRWLRLVLRLGEEFDFGPVRDLLKNARDDSA